MPKNKPSHHSAKPHTSNLAEARELLSQIEESQVPFGQSAELYNKLKAKIEADGPLTNEEHDELSKLVKIAKEWQRGVESSARTEPEETLAG